MEPWQFILFFVIINILLTLVILILEIAELSRDEDFRVNRWYARLRRQGNPYFDFPVIRAPTVKFPNF